MTTTIKQFRTITFLAPLIAVALAAPAALSQDTLPEGQSVIEVGGRSVWGDVVGRSDLPFNPTLRASKFNEYRDITDGFFLRNADITLEDLLSSRNYLNVQARSSFLKDQSYLITLGMPGKYKFQFRWDQTPHLFTNVAQTLYTQSTPGVFTLPGELRSRLAANPQSASTLFAGVPALDVSLRRKSAAVDATFDPTPDWTLAFQFSREKQAGSRPFGNYSPGYELPEPIDYRTTQVQAKAEYGKQRWGVEIGYLGSIFENKVDTLIWDLGFVTTGQGRIDLYPDNRAQDVNITGAFDLSRSTRVMLSIAPGWMSQNDAFIPFSVNPTPISLQLPASSLKGSKQTLAMNYTLVNHSVKHVELTARYRSYDYNNNTPSMLFPDYVLLDSYPASQLAGASRRMPRQNLPYGFNRKSVQLSAAWEFAAKNSLRAGYEFERYDRQHRDVGRSDENAFFTSWDLNPNKLTLVRLSYRRSDRSPNRYVENIEGFPRGVEEARQQLDLFRRFDEAARVRNRTEALVQFTPLEALAVSGTFGTTQDKFHESPYGLQREISLYYTVDADYSLGSSLSVFAGYAREKYRTRQRSRLMCALGTGPCAGINNSPNNDWESANRELTDTWTLGSDLYLAKRKVTLSAFYDLSASKGSIFSYALGDSRLPGFLLDNSLPACVYGGCAPENYPDTSHRLHEVVASLKFALPRGLSPRLEYRYERYDRTDWQTQWMRPYMYSMDVTSNTQFFLGADAPSYRAHVFTATLEYRF